MRKFYFVLALCISIASVQATSTFKNNISKDVYSFNTVDCFSTRAICSIDVLCASPPTVVVTQPTCVLSTGSINIVAVAGETYSFDGGPFLTILLYIGLPAGSSHSVEAKDSAGCISSSTNVTLNAQPITPNNPIIAVITQPTCSLATGSVAISGLPSGNWTLNQAGTVINSIIGNTSSTTISGLVPGNYTFSVTNSLGCISISSVNVNIPAQPIQPDAGIDGATTICETSSAPIDLFSLITGEQAGGTWTRTGIGGTFNAAIGTFSPSIGATTSSFTYTIPGSGSCSSDSSVATVNVFQQPDAGFDGCISVSDTNPTPIDLFSLITGEETNGTWSRTSGSGGAFSPVSGVFFPTINTSSSTFTYIIYGAPPCIDDSSIATVIINGSANGQAVTLFCDPANSTANSVAFDWNNVGQASFNYSYSINGSSIVRGNTTISNFQVPNLFSGASVTFTVQPIGNNCYPSTTTTCNLLSAANFESDSVEYYPNPFNDILNLKFDQPVKSIQIFNLIGQQVFSNYYNEKDLQINLSHLSSGTYLLKAISQDAFMTFKIVKN